MVARRPRLYAAGVTDTAFEAPAGAGVMHGTDSGDGPALLLLHGGPGLSDYMELLGPETGGWRTLRYQQRGLAPSPAGGPFTLAQHVADAVAVLDARGVDRAVVLGHSWGGHLALHLAVAHPDRVAALVLVDGLGVIGDGGVTALGQEMVSRLSPETLGQLAEVGGRLAGPDPSDDDATEQTRLLWPAYFADPAHVAPWPPRARVSLAAYAGTFASIAEQLADGFAESLGGITVPAIFVLGERSPMPVSQGEQTAALIPGAEVEIVPGAGHLPWYEQPGSVAAALSRVRAAVS
jgi:proline iminopeptidase